MLSQTILVGWGLGNVTEECGHEDNHCCGAPPPCQIGAERGELGAAGALGPMKCPCSGSWGCEGAAGRQRGYPTYGLCDCIQCNWNPWYEPRGPEQAQGKETLEGFQRQTMKV